MRRSLKFSVVFTAVCLIMTLMIAPMFAASSATLSDISGNWAEEQIIALNKVGIIDGYPDGTFKPDENITRAEFAKIVSRAFGYAPSDDSNFIDMEDHWAKHFVSALSEADVVNGYPDGRYEPYKNISRAEMVTMLARVAQLGDISETDSIFWAPSYADVDAGHWAFRFIEIASKLDIVPINYGVVFQPDKPATRAETAYMVSALRQSQFARGTATDLSYDGSSITVQLSNGESATMAIGKDAVVYRNGAISSRENIMKNDEVLVIGTSYGTTKFVMAEGIVTRDDIVQKVSSLTNGILTPDQVDLIADGKWDDVSESLTPALTERMESLGMNEKEAEAILSQDWQALPELGKDRLSQAISKEIGISSDLVTSIMDRDWDKAKTYAQLDAAQLLLSRLMKSK